ncbi:tetratricopeptide repeat protein [Iamia sp.]|uniref:tetratricopeptide repeat protein n=1 Tax=Iamia sp. TaxID=2722710 RepID=UPI002C615F11|nr:tetratricopeptide repeat protein [Iamia sp.]HXH56615.1 tetratricopeptide repeat protein [Iamia sp.]
MSLLRRPVVLLGVLLVVVGLAATIASVQGDGGRETPGSGADIPSTSSSTTVSAEEGRIADLQARIESNPDDWEALAALGSAYVARAAVTGDPALYPPAEEAVERSLEIQPEDNLPGTIAQSSLAAARHDFTSALESSERATAIAPESPDAKAVLGDALLELGRYDEAFATFQAIVDTRPDLAAYARVSYALELQGDIDGAIAAMEAAEQAATVPSAAAFAVHQLGELEWNRGNVDEAVEHYRRALRIDPGYVRSEAALARATFFAGDADEAITRYRAIVDRLPLPQYVSELAGVYTVTGQADRADEQLELLEVQRRLFEDAGVRVDADIAVINANHGLALDESLAAMESEWEARKSVFVADALAWQLHTNGRSEEALEYADEALRLGTRSALFYFHRSEIHRALGDDDAAERDLSEAEAINPNFSILHAAP